MCYFDCNAPGTTWYSVVSNGTKVISIHTHKEENSDVGFYKDVGDGFNWIYIPINEGEHLTEIYMRYRTLMRCKVLFRIMVRFNPYDTGAGSNGTYS